MKVYLILFISYLSLKCILVNGEEEEDFAATAPPDVAPAAVAQVTQAPAEDVPTATPVAPEAVAQETQASVAQVTQAPVAKVTQAPVAKETQAPIAQVNQAPVAQVIQVPVAQDTNDDERRRKEFKDKLKKGLGKLKARAENGSSIMGVLRKKYKPFFNCMGTDWWSKCKHFLAKCTVVPNSAGCLLGLSCGTRNAKKCGKLLPMTGSMLTDVQAENPGQPPVTGKLGGLLSGMAARSAGKNKLGLRGLKSKMQDDAVPEGQASAN